MPRFRKPRAVVPGDTIGIAAPAFPADAGALAAGTAALREAGFRIRSRRDPTLARGYLAGTDAARAKELMGLVDDPRVDAILCVRGGYGCQRMVGGLDAARVREAGKPLIGFSDVTTLLLWQRKLAGLGGFHGLMFNARRGPSREEVASLVSALAGEAQAPFLGQGRRRGVAQGRLVGGSLTLLAASLGTPWEVDTRGAILLIEEIGERPYALDRLLTQLGAAGKLAGVQGIGVGHLVGCDDKKRTQPEAEEVLMELLAPLGVPLVFGLPFGHQSPNLTWPVGVRAELDGRRGTLMLLESGVQRG
ncbi:MAG: LD-carboxypeptidase [Deltaproteobacteria bacterium]|nr:LD-carboxypeptidase [Deltaproteobacteria bacterium]